MTPISPPPPSLEGVVGDRVGECSKNRWWAIGEKKTYMKEQAVKENRIRNRVSRAVESAFDQTVNGDAVKDRKYIQRYEITLKHFYIEIEQYRRLLPEIKRDARNQQSKRPTGAAKGTSEI